MSTKRQATSELNHDNWDQEDPTEQKEMGKFKTASKDVLENRVIKTAKRRTVGISNDEPKKSIFSGFGEFSKKPPASFDFLSNLTKGVKTNGTTSNATDSSPSTLGTLTSSTGIIQGGLFSSSATFPSSNNLTSTSSSPKSSLFSASGSTPPSSVFTMKVASPTESPFKIKTNNTETNKLSNSPGQTPFGGVPKQGLFTTSTCPPPKVPVSQNIESLKSVATKQTSSSSKQNDSELCEYQLNYYSKLKALNEAVSDWIKTHVEATPLCILTPIFKDYDNHLKVIQGEYEKEKAIEMSSKDKCEQTVANNNGSIAVTTTVQFTNNKPTTFFNSNITPSTQAAAPTNNSTGFSFGIKSSPSTTKSSSSTPGLTFGPTATTPNKSPFASNSTPTKSPFASNATPTSGTAAPFSFGIGKPFSFNANVQKPVENTEDKDEDADGEPPKVEFTPIIEESSVYDKKCKIFVKKDGNFVEKGVGTLYIKKIEDSEKHQLLVRANNNLGNVLLNFILSSSIPSQRMGKNNVMMVCIPTPDTKPPPTPILIRVKTSEEADELLETLNKFKA